MTTTPDAQIQRAHNFWLLTRESRRDFNNTKQSATSILRQTADRSERFWNAMHKKMVAANKLIPGGCDEDFAAPEPARSRDCEDGTTRMNTTTLASNDQVSSYYGTSKSKSIDSSGKYNHEHARLLVEIEELKKQILELDETADKARMFIHDGAIRATEDLARYHAVMSALAPCEVEMLLEMNEAAIGGEGGDGGGAGGGDAEPDPDAMQLD